MLLDKFDSQPAEIYTSPRPIPQARKPYYQQNSKLPRISQQIQHQHHNSASNILSPRHNKQGTSHTFIEKSFAGYEEQGILRVPKVSARNLPDVFIPLSQGGRRLKKITSAIRDKLKHSVILEKLHDENIRENSPFRSYISPYDNKNDARSFISPMRPVNPSLSKKRHSLFHNEYGSQVLTQETFTHRNRLLSATPSPMVYPQTDPTISPKQDYFGGPSKIPGPIKQISDKSNAIVQSHRDLLSDPPSVGLSIKSRIDPDVSLSNQIKKLFILKKLFSKSKSPETNMEFRKDEVNIRQIKLKEPIAAPVLKLNELITMKKMKSTVSNGVVKRMLHAPSFRVYDIQEEPIIELKSQETFHLKDWLNYWKKDLCKSKSLARVYSCFWNFPEGCLSVLLEPAKRGYLSDILHSYGGLPEKCILTIAKELLPGIVDIHEKTGRIHGYICASEIMFDAKGMAKLTPGISYQPGVLAKLIDSSGEKPHYNLVKSIQNNSSNFSHDIFDLGLTLLYTALGELNSFDLSASLTPENIKLAMESITVKKNHKNSCCLLHSEEVIKKALGFMHPPSNNVQKSRVMKNNFNASGPRKQTIESSRESHFTLFDLLTMGNRFSESFIDFLCCCLKLDPTQRLDAKELLNHEFLSDNHHFCGPLITVNEILKMNENDGRCFTEDNENMEKNHINKFCEALHVVFLDKEVRNKFDLISGRNPIRNHDDKKIIEVANELDVSPKMLWENLVYTVFPKT